MAPRFWSKEWVEAGVQKANSDEAYLKKTAKYTNKTWVVMTDCPDGNDVSVKFTFNKGKIVNYDYETKPAPADFRIGNSPWDESMSLFRAQASYETWGKIQRKELNPLAAQNANLYVFEGQMIKMLAVMGYIMAFSDIQASVPCEY